jgi:hypothetical protein
VPKSEEARDVGHRTDNDITRCMIKRSALIHYRNAERIGPNCNPPPLCELAPVALMAGAIFVQVSDTDISSPIIAYLPTTIVLCGLGSTSQ